MRKIILSDENNLYIKHGVIHKLIKELGTGSVGMYLTLKSLEYNHPEGVNETKLLESSSDDLKTSKLHLENLIKKGYLTRNDKGFIISNNKTIL